MSKKSVVFILLGSLIGLVIVSAFIGYSRLFENREVEKRKVNNESNPEIRICQTESLADCCVENCVFKNNPEVIYFRIEGKRPSPFDAEWYYLLNNKEYKIASVKSVKFPLQSPLKLNISKDRVWLNGDYELRLVGDEDTVFKSASFQIEPDL